MLGKKKCKILKEIRAQIAEANDIAYVVEECGYKGNCRGTCPRCEQEVQYLEQELEKKRRLGKKVAVAGIAGAMAVSMTGVLSGCQAVAEENQTDGTTSGDYYQEKEYQTDTEMEVPTPTEGAAPRRIETEEDANGDTEEQKEDIQIETTEEIEESTEETQELEGDVATAPVQLG